MSTTLRFDDVADEESIRSHRGGPTWEIARHFPNQGDWTEQEFLKLTDERHIEFNDGCLEFLPLPTKSHQDLLLYVCVALLGFVRDNNLGRVYTSGYRIKLREGNIREPDVLFVAHNRTLTEQFSQGADLVIEIVSPGRENRERDLITKREDYASAGVPEYWIVDPESTTISVLTLKGAAYRVHGEFKAGDMANSLLLPGFTINVTDCFAAAQ
ncbi:MAG: Uma2 family endonuclease [Planctomycetaceae bacterium]|nr:Uma2 family endonuclease [Planctomycetaceae bacterium]